MGRSKKNVPLAAINTALVLDDIDYALLEILQENCRRKNTETSGLLALRYDHHLKDGPVGARIDRLVEHGYIKATPAILEPKRFGLGVTAVLTAKLRDKTAENVRAFKAAALESPYVMCLYEVLGDLDYVITIRAGDVKHARDLAAALTIFKADVVTLVVSEILRESTDLRTLAPRRSGSGKQRKAGEG